jgi:hypothetical protein
MSPISVLEAELLSAPAAVLRFPVFIAKQERNAATFANYVELQSNTRVL